MGRKKVVPEEIADGLAKARTARPGVKDALRKRARTVQQRLDRRDLVTGGLLAEWREARAMSQTELGRRLVKCLDGSALSFYELGKSSPTVRQLLNILGGLSIPGDTDRERLSNFFAGPKAAARPVLPVLPDLDVDLIVRVVAATLAEQARSREQRDPQGRS